MKKYQITDPSYFPRNRSGFSRALSASVKRFHPDFVCLRDRENPRYEALARLFVRLCRRFHTKPVLHNYPIAAKRLGAFGVHLSGSMRREIGKAKRSGVFVIASTHSRSDAARALRLGADRIVISPIFKVADKGSPLGVSFLQSLSPTIRSKTIVLGGIVNEERVRRLSGVFAFASIRFFARKDSNGF